MFLNTPGNGLFAGGTIFALGLHLGGENRDLKKVSDLTAFFFMQKYEFLPSELPLPSDVPSDVPSAVTSAARICRQNLGAVYVIGRWKGVR